MHISDREDDDGGNKSLGILRSIEEEGVDLGGVTLLDMQPRLAKLP